MEESAHSSKSTYHQSSGFDRQPSYPQSHPGQSPQVTMSSQNAMHIGGTNTTPRQTAFKQEDTLQSSTSAGLPHEGAGASMGNHIPHNYLAASAPNPSFSAPAFHGFSPSQWPSFTPQYPANTFGRSAYTTLPQSTDYSAEGMAGIPSAHFTYESPSSASDSPVRTSNYHEMLSAQLTHASASNYAFHGGDSSSEGSLSNPYGMMASPSFHGNDIDSMLEQVSTLYKNANTKKMAEFYRDKWARMWLSCNYTLKPLIQISIPRTILHESYRQACESFSLEPLQAASFGKVLRSQFPDVAQRRLGGRGKTRFHYCGFGTATEREALKVKSLLEEEKAGRLQLSAGMSAEFSGVPKAKAKSEGHDPSSTSPTKGIYLGESHNDRAPRAISFANSGPKAGTSSSLNLHSDSQDERLAASAFATLTGPMSTASGSSGSHLNLHQQLPHQDQHQALSLSSGQTGAIPRRHTVSHAQSYPTFPDMMFLSNTHIHGFPASPVTGLSMRADNDYSSEGQTGDQSSLASQLNSPASSLLGYNHGHSSQNEHQIYAQRSCMDLPDWPRVDERGQAPGFASGILSSSGRKAWREYEEMCQDLLHCIYPGPDLNSFEQRTISFWSNVSSPTHDALQSEPLLSEVMLRADSIIFRQLLTRLDEMIGDDFPAEQMSGIQVLSNTLSNKIHGLMKGKLSGASIEAKIRSSQNVAQSLERIAKIFEAVRAFRDNAMLDVASYWQRGTSRADSFPARHALTMAQEPHVMTSTFSTPAQSNLATGMADMQHSQRDMSLGSSVSDSLSAWIPEEEPANSDAICSDPGSAWSNDHVVANDLPSTRHWIDDTRLQTRPGYASEVSGPVHGSVAGLVMSGQAESERISADDSN